MDSFFPCCFSSVAKGKGKNNREYVCLPVYLIDAACSSFVNMLNQGNRKKGRKKERKEERKKERKKSTYRLFGDISGEGILKGTRGRQSVKDEKGRKTSGKLIQWVESAVSLVN